MMSGTKPLGAAEAEAEARARMPMQKLQAAVTVDMDARRDQNAARRHEAIRLYQTAIEALEEALQRAPQLLSRFLFRLQIANVFSMRVRRLLTRACAWAVEQPACAVRSTTSS